MNALHMLGSTAPLLGGDAAGAQPPEPERHLLGAGHLVLETHDDEIAALTRDLLGRHLRSGV